MFGDNNPTKRLTKVMQTALQVLTTAFFSQKALISLCMKTNTPLCAFMAHCFAIMFFLHVSQ